MYRLGNRRGQTTMLFTLGLTTIVGMIGLVVDFGWAYFREQAAQTAAEAAAMGAAKAALDSSGLAPIVCGGHVVCQNATSCPETIPTATTNFHNGCYYAKDNGFTTTSNGDVKVLIAANTTSPPVSGLTASYWVTATVITKQRQGFSAILGNSLGVVSAKATAVILPSSSFGCIYVLNPTAAGALTVSGTTSVTSPCGVYVNSSNSQALNISGSGCLNASPGTINVVGGAGTTSCISPAATTGVSTFTDPLATAAAPAWSGCDHAGQVMISAGIVILSPGVYCGGIKINSLAVVTFLPGTYVLNGGGLNISGSNTIITGTGVTFYNTADATHSYDTIRINGGTTLNLTAPLGGPLANILFFQDRAIVSSSVNTINGGATGVFSGVLYFRNSPLSFSGNSVSTNVSIVADTVTFTGNSLVTGNVAGGNSARIGLVE